jgi:hypothetical protein
MDTAPHLSRMKRIRSFANNPRLDKHEKPNRAKVKKKTPADGNLISQHTNTSQRDDIAPNLFWNPPISSDTLW